MPLLVKGVLTAEDARLAVETGAAGIIVSNHGGRQLDGALATCQALTEVVEAVGGHVEVLVDGGIRRGTDVLKALAMGAQEVLIGRPYLWGISLVAVMWPKPLPMRWWQAEQSLVVFRKNHEEAVLKMASSTSHE